MKKGNSWKLLKKGDKPIWNEYINEATGERSLEVHTKKTLISSRGCNHDYQPIDNLGNIQCQHCHIGTRIIRGIHSLENGRIKVIKK